MPKNSGMINPKNDIERTKSYVNDRYTEAETKRRNMELIWTDCMANYMSINPNDTDDYFIPETNTCVETYLPRLVGPFLNNPQGCVSFEGRNAEDHDSADKVEKLISYAFTNSNVPMKCKEFYRRALIYGTAFGKTSWKVENVKTKRYGLQEVYEDEIGNPLMIPGRKIVVQDVEKILYDDPYFENVSIYDFYIDPAATSLENARFVCEKKKLTKQQLLESAMSGTLDLEAVKKLPDQGDAYDSSDKKTDQDRRPFTQEVENPSLPRRFEVIEYWEKNRVVVVAEGDYVLRDTENPRWDKRIPYIDLRFIDVPDQYYGIGLAELIKTHQSIMNDLQNALIDNVKLNVNPVLTYAQNAIDPKDAKKMMVPGAKLKINASDLDKVRWITMPDMSRGTDTAIMRIKSDIQNITGVSDIIRGMMSEVAPKEQTAYEVMEKTKQASSRFELTFKTMAEQSFKQIAIHFLHLYQQYLTEDKEVKILGDSGKTLSFINVSIFDIQGDYDLKISVDPQMMIDTQHKQNLIGFLQTIMNEVILAKIPDLRLNEIVDEIAEEFGIEPEKIHGGQLPQPPGMMPGQQQQMQQFPQTMSMPGGFGGIAPGMTMTPTGA